MSYEAITLEEKDGVWTLTINRPDAMNALNRTVLKEIAEAMTQLEQKKARGLILRGAGEKVFVAGADIKAMQGLSQGEAQQFAREGQEAFFKIEQASFPTLAAVRGFALGGGLELAMAADLIVAGEGAKLGQPEVSLGLVTGFAGSMRLPRLVGPGRAKELLMSGRKIGAQEAERIGLVARVVPDDQLFATAEEMMQKMARNAPLAVAGMKRLVNETWHMERHEAGELEAKVFGEMFATKDHEEGIEAFLGKRKPSFQGK